MIGYETEEQQVQAIKQFWKDNGTAIILGAVIGLGGLWGWRYFNDYQVQQKETASLAFQDSVEALVENEDKVALENFIAESGSSGYAPLGAMILAQDAVGDGDFEAAVSALTKAIGGDDALSDVARLRLAKLHLQLNEYDKALSVLDSVGSDSFSDQVEELKGDAYFFKGDFDAAKDAYTVALAQVPNNQGLKMKRDNIEFAKSKATDSASE